MRKEEKRTIRLERSYFNKKREGAHVFYSLSLSLSNVGLRVD